MNKKKLDFPVAWQGVLKPFLRSEAHQRLQNFLFDAYQQSVVYPPVHLIFKALDLVPPENVKVVILGQDPYHRPGQAHGLSFSVMPPQPLPPSLRNILKAYCLDLNLMFPPSGDLTPWAHRGVLLLNTTLTVAEGKPESHFNKGWELLTDAIIAHLNHHKKHLVFMLWGSKAQQKKTLIDPNKHLILEAPHPSPLSAHRGFLDCKHFSKANFYLMQHGVAPINWDLSQ